MAGGSTSTATRQEVDQWQVAQPPLPLGRSSVNGSGSTSTATRQEVGQWQVAQPPLPLGRRSAHGRWINLLCH